MSNYDGTASNSHPIAGLILGLLGIIAALLLCFLCGVVGAGIAVLLGAIALLLGIKARKSGKGMGAIITGALAVILAVIMTVSTVGVMNELQKKAQETGETPLMEKYASKPYLGLLGVVIEAAKDGESNVEALMAELEILNKAQ